MLRERYIKAGTTQGTKTRVFFILHDATDYVTPETGEAGGQPQISFDGGTSWSDSGIGTLSRIGTTRNWYYAELTTATVAAANVGKVVLTAYKSFNTAEATGTSVIITANDPYAETQTVSLGTSTIGASQIVDGALTAAKFGAASITSTTLADGAITAAKIASNAVTATKIADDAVTSAKLATGALSADAVAANTFISSAFASSLDAYTVTARLVQTGASAQQVVVFIYKNGEQQGSGAIDPAPTIGINTTALEAKISGVSLSEFGDNGWYTSLSGASLLDAGDAAEATVQFVVGVTSIIRSVPIEKQYA